MTDTERKRLVIVAMRNVRRYYRQGDTAGEILERWLDRQIKRKTLPTPEQAHKLIPLWEDHRNKIQAMERAISDYFDLVTHGSA